jgi:hypothetical protein
VSSTLRVSLLSLFLYSSPAWSQDPNGTVPTPEGFTALIGKDLSNWQDAAKLAPNWKVENNLLVNDGKGQNAVSVKSYRNFELRLDWKIPASGDSGVFLPGGQQIQIHARKQSGGFVWNHVPPVPLLADAANPIGEWNSFRIVLVNGKVTVHLNGKLVMDSVPVEKGFVPEKTGPVEGPIAFQRSPHAKTTTFRNVFIKELPVK